MFPSWFGMINSSWPFLGWVPPQRPEKMDKTQILSTLGCWDPILSIRDFPHCFAIEFQIKIGCFMDQTWSNWSPQNRIDFVSLVLQPSDVDGHDGPPHGALELMGSRRIGRRTCWQLWQLVWKLSMPTIVVHWMSSIVPKLEGLLWFTARKPH